MEAHYHTARAQVEKLTPSLLAKAFRGELVPQDPNDEPASELLARIAAARSTDKQVKTRHSSRAKTTPSSKKG
jgi:type I restriction enzyme S subunit